MVRCPCSARTTRIASEALDPPPPALSGRCVWAREHDAHGKDMCGTRDGWWAVSEVRVESIDGREEDMHMGKDSFDDSRLRGVSILLPGVGTETAAVILWPSGTYARAFQDGAHLAARRCAASV